ncbi:MAG: hypothetical protein QOK35_3191, partial [Pseudonocardiales bacterium]|nr:hypothetical protein [Pseudonocardiales bacterium]
MSEAGAVVGRWLTSRKNLFGSAGALVGVGLAFADVSSWPLVAVGLYAVGALVAPGDPPETAPRLIDELRDELGSLLGRMSRSIDRLPEGVFPALQRIGAQLNLVLDRLDEVADGAPDRVAAPERLATVQGIVRVDLPECLDGYLDRGRASSHAQAAGELVKQLDVIASAA